MVRVVSEFLAPPPLDLAALHAGRLARLRSTMADHGLDLCVLTNPVNLRYAANYRSFPLFQSHIPSTYLMVPVEGPLVLYGGYCSPRDTGDENRPAHSVTSVDAGRDRAAGAAGFADDVAGCLGVAGQIARENVGTHVSPQ